MRINQLHEAMEVCFEAGLTPVVIGQAGIGKSQTIRQYAENKGIGFIDLRLGQMADAADIIGLPELIKETQQTKFFKPSFLPTEGEGILFLDEINRTTKDILQAVFQLVLDRKINEYELPPGWKVVAAKNPETDDYDVLDFDDAAFSDRFCQIKLTPTTKEWIDYCKGQGVETVITDFISEQPDFLEDQNLKEFSIEAKPSRRTWKDQVDKILKLTEPDSEIQKELIQGVVGVTIASAFFDFQKNYHNLPKGKDIVDTYEKVKPVIVKNVENNRTDMLSTICDNVADYVKKIDELSPTQEDNIAAFIMDIPKDLAFGFTLKQLMVIETFNKSNLLKTESDIGQKIFSYFQTIEAEISNLIKENENKNEG